MGVDERFAAAGIQLPLDAANLTLRQAHQPGGLNLRTLAG